MTITIANKKIALVQNKSNLILKMILFRIDVTFEMRTVKCVYSIDNHTQNQIIFYIRMEEGARGQDSREKERERARERERA
jgi:hypothetical protein